MDKKLGRFCLWVWLFDKEKGKASELKLAHASYKSWIPSKIPFSLNGGFRLFKGQGPCDLSVAQITVARLYDLMTIRNDLSRACFIS
jgi:hypothetical protein